MQILVISLAVVILALLGLYFWQLRRYNAIRLRYKDVIDVDSAIAVSQKEHQTILSDIEKTKADYGTKRALYDELLKEISILEENLENISYGLYKPHFTYETSEEFARRLEEVRERQKILIKNEQATHCATEWTVGGSKREGQRMVKQASKLMLRAFNGECDAAVAKVKWNNIGNMEARINKAFEAINKLGTSNRITITKGYLDLKMEELHLEFEMEEKIYQEKEEQRRIKEEMREEERALKEIEKAKKQAEEDEQRYQKALEVAREEIASATGAKLDKLNAKIQELEERLQQAREQKERAISRAQLTKSGHVYIISNIGSFGDNIFKIGMTRRLDPIDRVKELGDASVPFDFDVHAMFYSDNAPELENSLHRKLEDKRVNLVNLRREFFFVTIEDIAHLAIDMNIDLKLTKLAEAKEYRESKSIREAKDNIGNEEKGVADKLPKEI